MTDRRIARLYSDGYCVRVDLHGNGRRYPNTGGETHIGFAFLERRPEGKTAWDAAEQFARANGAAEVLRDPN